MLAVDAAETLPVAVVAGCDLVVDLTQATLYSNQLDGAGSASWSLPVGSALHQLYQPILVQAVILGDGGPLGGSDSLSDGYRVVVLP